MSGFLAKNVRKMSGLIIFLRPNFMWIPCKDFTNFLHYGREQNYMKTDEALFGKEFIFPKKREN